MLFHGDFGLVLERFVEQIFILFGDGEVYVIVGVALQFHGACGHVRHAIGL